MDIKILGADCPKCKMLLNVTQEALKEAGIKTSITKIEDLIEIMQYGVINTPALVVDGVVVSKGDMLSVNEIVLLLKK